jgi:hypothetical protein
VARLELLDAWRERSSRATTLHAGGRSFGESEWTRLYRFEADGRAPRAAGRIDTARGPQCQPADHVRPGRGAELRLPGPGTAQPTVSTTLGGRRGPWTGSALPKNLKLLLDSCRSAVRSIEQESKGTHKGPATSRRSPHVRHHTRPRPLAPAPPVTPRPRSGSPGHCLVAASSPARFM